MDVSTHTFCLMRPAMLSFINISHLSSVHLGIREQNGCNSDTHSFPHPTPAFLFVFFFCGGILEWDRLDTVFRSSSFRQIIHIQKTDQYNDRLRLHKETNQYRLERIKGNILTNGGKDLKKKKKPVIYNIA